MKNYIIKISPPTTQVYYYHPRAFPKDRKFAWKLGKREANAQIKLLKTMSPDYQIVIEPE